MSEYVRWAAHDETQALRWFDPNELEALAMSDPTRATLRTVLQAT